MRKQEVQEVLVVIILNSQVNLVAREVSGCKLDVELITFTPICSWQ
jgi:hypothetical protein